MRKKEEADLAKRLKERGETDKEREKKEIKRIQRRRRQRGETEGGKKRGEGEMKIKGDEQTEGSGRRPRGKRGGGGGLG